MKINSSINSMLNKIVLKLETEDGKCCILNTFDKLKDNVFSFRQDEFCGELSFMQKDNAIVSTVKVAIVHDSSYIHPRFKESGVSIVLNIDNESNFLAHYNYNGWWTRPHFAKQCSEIPDNTQVLSWQKEEDSFVLLTVCDGEFKSLIKGDENGVNMRFTANTNGYSYINTKAFVLAFDNNPYKAYEIAMKTALDTLDTTNRDSQKRRYPDMFNFLGFCTWNAFYSDVNEEGVLKKAEEFKAKNLPVKWFLIDHGWSKSENEKLAGFEEDFDKFPSGLKGLKLKLNELGVNNLGVWQGFGGHWGAIAENSVVYKQMRENLLSTNTGHIIPYPSKEKSFAFWNAWHRYLKKQDVDFVKVDIQSSLIIFTKGVMPIGKAAKESHLGLEASVGVNFDGALINCMGMGMEAVLNRPVSGINRNSNDFFPHKEKSFKAHVYENVYNTLYHGIVGHGDWDMWWTNHKESKNNAYLRALSGGPLYISDRLNDTQEEFVFPLILSDGYVLRCDKQGVISKSQIYKKADMVKVCNIKGDTAYLGVFNCDLEEKTATTTISLQDLNDLKKVDRYLMYDYNLGVAKTILADGSFDLELKGSGSALYSFTPIVNGKAFLGLCDKYISSAAIEYNTDKFCILKEGGDVLFYSEEDVSVRVNGKEAKAQIFNNIYRFNCIDEKEKIIIELR